MDDEWRVVTLMFTDKHMEEHPVDSTASLSYRNGKLVAQQPYSLRGDASTPGNVIIYFSAPQTYLGNRVTSYGGTLRYSIMNQIEDKDGTGLVAADLVLSGNNITIIHEHIEQPTMDEPFQFSTKIIEREFRHLNGFEVTREQMMMVLVNLDAIYIRGSMCFLECKGIENISEHL